MPARCRWRPTIRATWSSWPARYAGGVYLHWNFWCNVQVPAQQDLCRLVRAGAPVETVRTYRERDYAFAFYKIAIPASAGGTSP